MQTLHHLHIFVTERQQGEINSIICIFIYQNYIKRQRDCLKQCYMKCQMNNMTINLANVCT